MVRRAYNALRRSFVADVLVVGEKIAAVGPKLEAPRGARVIDATGKFVIPGGIDTRKWSRSRVVRPTRC